MTQEVVTESATNLLVWLFVNRASPECWVVRDPGGKLWLVPPVDSPWQNRRRFYSIEETELEPAPGHYRYLLELPF